MLYDIIGRHKIMMFQLNALTCHSQPEDNLYSYYDITVRRKEMFHREDSHILAARALPCKSLPELWQRH